VRPHSTLRRLLVRRLDRSVTTGFLLTLALACSLAAGVLLGVLVYLIRSVDALHRVDNSVANWGFANRTSFSTSGLQAITQLGSIRIVAGLAVAVAAIDFYRTRGRWSLPFLIAVLTGIELITLAVKDIVGRVRPALTPAAAHLGPSFPSGHSATSAAFYAALALILGRRLARPWRQILIGLAVAVAVAVAASRVLLDLHWFSDVVGGLALGWGWFALCAAVFGGRLLRPTAAADVAAAEAAGPERGVRGRISQGAALRCQGNSQRRRAR
jgi:membrane-associated phospholipid phosphatase